MFTMTAAPLLLDVAVTGSQPDFMGRSEQEPRDDASESANPLAWLVRITQSNDRLLGELTQARRRVDQALAYASDPASRPALGAALVAHARQRQAKILTRLRRNRSEAIAILASLPAF